MLTKSRGRFLEYVLDRDDVRPVWKHFTEHVFVQGIADGSLPEERFKHYLVQDYLYLVRITMTYGISAYDLLHAICTLVCLLTAIACSLRSILLEAMRWRHIKGRIWSPFQP